MIGEPTERAGRLREKLAVNAQRLKRRNLAEGLVKIGGTVAAACDRFSLHLSDPGLHAVEAWIRRNGNGYSGRKPDVVLPIDWSDLASQIRDLVRRHGLEGWCVLFLYSGNGSDCGIGLDVSQVHALTEEFLDSPNDILFVSEAHRWCVNIHHEGELWLWRDIDWGVRDGIR